MANRVLILTTSFIPDNTGRALRISNRVKYLSKRSGWEPVVYVVNEEPNRKTIDLDSEEIPVYRAPYDNTSTNDSNNLSNNKVLNTSISYLKPYVKEFLIPTPIPDTYIGSAFEILKNTKGIINSEDIDIVVTMCYPFSLHLIGGAVKFRTNVFWVAEFRDPWVTNPNHFNGQAGRYHRTLEKFVVRNANKIVYNYGIQVPKNYFKSTYASYSFKIHKVDCPGSCGFDFEMLNGSDPPSRPFRITYGGGFWQDGNSPKQFFEALKKFIVENNFSNDDIVVDFYGDWVDTYQDTVNRLNLNDIVSAHGWISPSSFILELEKSHIGLYIIRTYEGDELNVPQKVVDYIATETPMLVIGSKSTEAARFARKNGIGVVATNSEEDIYNNINKLFTLHQTGELSRLFPNKDLRARIDAENRAVEFGSILNSILQNSNKGL